MSGLEVAAGVMAVVTIAAQVAGLAMDYGKSVQSAFVEMNKLLEEVNRLKHTAERVQALLDGPQGHSLRASKPLREALDEALPLLEATRERLVPPPHSGKWKRMLKRAGWSARSKGIDDIAVGLARCAQNITNAPQVDQTYILAGLDRDQVFERLPHVGAAAYNSYAEENEAFCLPGTRTDLQHTILAWAKDPASSTLFWLHGIAGTGKSTVARTIARTLDSDGNLGASFFFKSGDGDRAKSSKVITTIASQLAAGDPELAALLRKTLASDPLLPDKSLQEQFQKLIYEPWTVLQDSCRHDRYHVVVLDALDECDDASSIKVLVRFFAQLSTLKSPRLLVFATSRAELTVRLGFHGVQATYQDLVLHEIPETVVKADIAVFIETETKRIRNDYNGTTIKALQLPENWPSRPDLEALVSMSVPLFIFAATACRFIGELMEGKPQEQLETFLSYKDTGGGSTLASTYTPVLDRLMRGVLDREKRVSNFRMVVGTIILAETPVSATLLHRLLDIDLATIWDMLNLLHSVLRVPDTKVEGSENLPIRLLHLSLRDFLLNPLTIERHALGISEKETHRYIAQWCRITLSRKLTRNICQLSYPGSSRRDIEYEQLQQQMAPDLMYACSYWMSHTAKGGVPGEICHEVLRFLQQFLLQWLEAMSCMGSTRHVAHAVHNLSQILDNGQEDLLDFLEDTKCFIQAHATQIHEAPLQVYSSALVFSPRSSIVRQRFKEGEPRWLSQLPAAQEDLDCVGLTVPYTHNVRNYALSSDAKILVTYSMSGYIRRFNAQTGRLIARLPHRSATPNCFVLSRCATFLAIGYCKYLNVAGQDEAAGSLKIVLLDTGEQSYVFANAEVAIGCVDFSPNGLLLAYASNVGRVSLRSVVNGEETQSFNFSMVMCHSIKFSSDSRYLAVLGTLDVGSKSAMTSISKKMGIAIWDVRNCSIVYVWVDVAEQVTRMITEGSIMPISARVILSDASSESAYLYSVEKPRVRSPEMYLTRINDNLPQVQRWVPECNLKLSVTGTQTSRGSHS
ncbi:uncharacterized protein J7T54_004494 [Emericellopsis cladophorae]|uniref:Nephrocystin 3-like N-terminal domain-containing protein n=1 Tax=Emericellopsis cladophorae TaxID=2686198 RepID=A0A9Q0BBY4_9HYPO|nr:uncharacterized protein J7T54_004494 [Emericellopsis cladophorae]KAI6779000.1 hypothetical protein J7T54_004494 [Emericellopsis cladophorae]